MVTAKTNEGLESTQSRDILSYMAPKIEETPKGWVTELGLYYPTDQKTEKHKWLGTAPELREWKGGREAHKPRDYGFELSNVLYEATIDLSLDDINRDKTGQIQPFIDGMVERYNNQWNKLATDLLNAAESTVCYDGEFWVDTDHPIPGTGSTKSNDITFAAETGTAPVVSEMVDAILANIETMFGFTDDQGAPINEDVNSFYVMIPTSLWSTTAKALGAELIGSGDSNIIKSGLEGFSITAIQNQRLTWSDKFMVFARGST